jgi:two-component system heavy metal sensor histidine kinase CusS
MSKAEPPGKQPATTTLAWRLTALYVALASLVLLAAVTTLYVELIQDLDREDDALMREHALVLDALLLQPQKDAASALLELEREREVLGARRMLVRIVDDRGAVMVATSRFPKSLSVDAFPRAMDARAAPLRGVDVEAEGVRYRAATILLESTAVGGQEATLQVAIDRATFHLLLGRYRNLLLGVAIPGVLLSGLIGFVVARRATAPLRLLAERIGAVHADNLDDRVPTDGMIAELRPVVASFNELLERLRNSFDKLRNFSSHLAHELRTPIHTLCAEIDTSLQDPASDRHEVLQSVRTEAEQIAKIVEGLLFLAYADRPGARIATRECDLRKLAQVVTDFYEPIAAENGVELTCDAPGEVVSKVDPTMVQRALGNLLANALAFTPRSGRVQVRVFSSPDGPMVEVEDDGVGIAPDRLQSIVDAAYRADSAGPASGYRTGLGIGLRIVESILRLHHGTLRLWSEPGRGCRATLQFPTNAPLEAPGASADLTHEAEQS